MAQTTVQPSGTGPGSAPRPGDAQGSGVAEQAQQKVADAAGQAHEQTQQAGQQMRGQLRDQVDQRSTDAGRKLHTTAEDMRSVGEQLRAQGKDAPAKIADEAAMRAQRIGRYLEQSSGDRILNDAEDFGRRQPWTVIAGGLALGFVASRLLKASSQQRYMRTANTRRQLSPTTTPQGNGFSTNPVGSSSTSTPGGPGRSL